MWKMLILAATLLGGCKEKCDAEGDFSCDGDLLLECVDGKLIEQEDCYAEDLVCTDEGNGDAYCESEYADEM